MYETVARLTGTTCALEGINTKKISNRQCIDLRNSSWLYWFKA